MTHPCEVLMKIIFLIFAFAGLSGNGIWRRPLQELSDITGTVLRPNAVQHSDFTLQLYNSPSSRMTVGFQLFRCDIVNVTLYDLSGRLLATPVVRTFGSGKHRVTFGTEAIAPGCYVVKVRAGRTMYGWNVLIGR